MVINHLHALGWSSKYHALPQLLRAARHVHNTSLVEERRRQSESARRSTSDDAARTFQQLVAKQGVYGVIFGSFMEVHLSREKKTSDFPRLG